jgi:iron complex transport system permease protein
LPVAALIGGLIVMLADLLGRTIFTPYEIPVGLITALIGAPYMIALLIRRRAI